MREKSIFQDVNFYAACLIKQLSNWDIKLPENEENVNMTSQTISLSEWCVEEGRKEGIRIGDRRGVRRGAKRGREQGIKIGLKQGIEQGIEQGIVGSVKALASVGASRQVISQQLVSVYDLSQEQAEKYIEDVLK